MTTSILSLMTAAMVLAAFRLPAYMMFRGMRSPLGLRRPIMVVRAPAARNMPGHDPRLLSRVSSLPQPAIPPSHPLLVPHFWSMPGHVVSPVQLPPPRRGQPPQASETFIKPILISTPHPNVNKEIKSSKSINNRPSHLPKRKHSSEWSTTAPSFQYEDRLHHVFRPSDQTNKFRKISKQLYSKKISTDSFNSLNSNQVSGNEETRYAMMYPMPRNYQNNQIESDAIKTTSTPLPLTSQSTTSSTIPTTTEQERKTKLWVKPLLKSNHMERNPLYQEGLRQINPTSTTTISPTLKSLKNKIRLNRTRVKTTTTTELTTIMTPAPIENYKPVKARVQTNPVHNDLDDKTRNISKQLMFDDSKNLYYFVTFRTV